MIPISPSKRKEWKDPKSGTLYEFRYMTSENEHLFVKLFSESSGDVKAYIAKARREVNAETKGKKLGVKRKEAMVMKRAEKYAAEESAAEGNLAYARDFVNTFLCGWKGDDLPEFPKDGKPARYFRSADLYGMVGVINGFIGELCGLGLEDAKN